MQADNRNSYRYPIQEGFRSAILKIGRQEYLVQLVEESAEGFSLMCAQPLACKIGNVVLLQHSAGVHQVEIAHITQQEDSTRIGLKRLSSVSLPKPPKSSGFASLFAGGGHRQGGLLSFVLFSLMGACLALFFTGGFFPWGPGAQDTPGSYQLVSPGGGFQRGLAGLNALTSEDIARQIGLSDVQRKNIQSIFRHTSQSLSQVYEDSDGDSAAWEQKSSELIEDAARRVVSSLTRDQLAEWSQILQQDTPAEPRS